MLKNYLLFTISKIEIDTEMNIRINNSSFDQVSSTKFLGVIINEIEPGLIVLILTF